MKIYGVNVVGAQRIMMGYVLLERFLLRYSNKKGYVMSQLYDIKDFCTRGFARWGTKGLVIG